MNEVFAYFNRLIDLGSKTGQAVVDTATAFDMPIDQVVAMLCEVDRVGVL